jgi:ABC-type nitrate/sulfonate/bicarbonate transport system substrate-binding protein
VQENFAMRHFRLPRLSVAFALALLLLAPLAPARTQELEKVRVGLSFVTYSNLPVMLAADKGYYRAAGLDVELQGFSGSSTAQMPRLARGDVDVMPLALGPAFFNQFSQGFDVKLVGALSATKKGWEDTTWLVVRQDEWDSKAIRAPKDLRGKIVDGVAPGSPIDFLALTTIAAAGLTANDVTYGNKFRDPASWASALTNKAVDVQGVPEPFATALQEQHFAHKWVGMADMAPWFNETFLAASTTFARDHHDALVRFMRATLHAASDIEAANGRWTPELVTSLAKYSQLPESTIRSIGTPAYPGDGQVDLTSVTRQEDFWHARGLVQTEVPASGVVDLTVLRDARVSPR